MDTLLNIINYMISFSVTFPFVLTFLLYLAFRVVTTNRVKSLQKAVDFSTIFYVLSIYSLQAMYMKIPLFSIIIVSLLLLFSAMIIYQRKNYNEIYIQRSVKILWRICFLIFSVLYVFFCGFGILRLIFM